MHAPILVAMLALSCAMGGCAKPRETSAAGCAIALDYAKRFKAEWDEKGRSIEVSRKPPFGMPERDSIERFLADNPKLAGDPEIALTLAAADLRDRSVTDECADLQSWLRDSGISRHKERPPELANDGLWRRAILQLSMPAISKDGSTALIYVSESAGPLAGRSMAVTYKKQENGQWSLHEKELLAIS